MAITFRADKGSALTYSELDTNFGSFIASAELDGTDLILHYAVSNNVPVSQSAITIPLSGSSFNPVIAPAGTNGSIQYNEADVLTGNETFLYEPINGILGVGYDIAYLQNLPNTPQTANHKFVVDGSIEASGNIYAFSDLTLKSNLTPIENGLGVVENITGYTYDKDGTRQAGLIAQELKEVLPEVVCENADGLLSVNYNGVVAALVEAVKTLQKRVEELENR